MSRLSATFNLLNKLSAEDELMMLQDLRKPCPFRVVSGSCHAHFPDIAISTTANLDVGELFT